MKVLFLKGFRIELAEIDSTTKALQDAVGGSIETIQLRDGGSMICDRLALPKDKPYNSLASLIAGSGVYGDAIICGTDGNGFCDMPDAFAALLNFPEDYFKDGAAE